MTDPLTLWRAAAPEILTGVIKVRSVTMLRIAHRLAVMEGKMPRLVPVTNWFLRRALRVWEFDFTVGDSEGGQG